MPEGSSIVVLREQAAHFAGQALRRAAGHAGIAMRKHWLVRNQSRCPRHHSPLGRACRGKTRRRSFFCERCQKRCGPA
ncbi:MAG TPA: hypothetical protein VIM06_04955 [Rhodanobacter sp.]